jgi:hypothetical protein
MGADAPTAGFVAVVPLHQLIDPRADHADDAELDQIRTEPGPEAVIRAGLVDRASVHRQPVIDRSGVENPKHACHRGGQ